ncbi:MAG TPA: RNA methyltransferase [Chryseolinea sp.]|nr:RNA methyltransferase [Chryseolinea sp.]
MHPIITSPHNPKIKNVLSLDKSRERNSQQVFLIEGMRELSLAVAGEYKLITVFFCPDIVTSDELTLIVHDENLLIPVERKVFEKMVYRESTTGVVAVAMQKKHLLENVKLGPQPLVLIVEGVEKPGNLGAILRTADAANLDAVIICETKTDFYNPNVIRSSVGCLFTMQTASSTADLTHQWLMKNKFRVFVTDLEASTPYYAMDYRGASAIVMGTEASGISDLWRKHAHEKIIIPMRGKIDSMNVSNAAAVIVFEALRQRIIG